MFRQSLFDLNLKLGIFALPSFKAFSSSLQTIKVQSQQTFAVSNHPVNNLLSSWVPFTKHLVTITYVFSRASEITKLILQTARQYFITASYWTFLGFIYSYVNDLQLKKRKGNKTHWFRCYFSRVRLKNLKYLHGTLSFSYGESHETLQFA